MHRSAILLFLLLLWPAAPALAQTEINHCVGARGGAVFTDQPCSALNATVVPASTATVVATRPTAPLPVLCAASLDSLRRSVIDTFAQRNANRLAGLMLWDGYDSSAAISDIRSLADLMKQPLLDVDIAGAADDSPTPARSTSAIGMPIAADTTAPTPVANPQLIVHVAGDDRGDNPRDRRFDVIGRAGCLWLRDTD